MSYSSKFSFFEEINLNDSIEYKRNSVPIEKKEFNFKSESITDLSCETKTSSTVSRKYIFFFIL